jgi:hypothetical protein
MESKKYIINELSKENYKNYKKYLSKLVLYYKPIEKKYFKH